MNNLATVLQATNRIAEAEPLMRRALKIAEQSYGENHPDVAACLNNLALLLQAINRFAEAEPLMRRALKIAEQSYGENHPSVATGLNNLAQLLKATNRFTEAEPLMRRALKIAEQSYGENHPSVATGLNNLAQLLKATNRLAEAEPLMRRMVEIFLNFTRATGHPHPHLQTAFGNYAGLLRAMGKPEDEIRGTLADLAGRYGMTIGGMGGRKTGNTPSPKLLAVLEEIMRDQSKLQEIAARLQRDDPALFQELLAFIKSQQKCVTCQIKWP
ncbi:tetratricopeptide repeat-containing protein [Oligosphaera ethanolica]|uniref:Tetratricopeptide (TPR) repeat protein n=1 Tax=Oligosphaera ethanolica TaxID=760260 RepID=A0AAE4ANQ9_9BACT|nr:tetratricopeptide repeat-containing protein [Oligosphaera ethanolica]MDQ0290529.1 tetratricopeptide (TPR) repeat protein [Oligosphaera ethanolica]